MSSLAPLSSFHAGDISSDEWEQCTIRQVIVPSRHILEARVTEREKGDTMFRLSKYPKAAQLERESVE